MLPDPLSITYDGNSKSLARVNASGASTRYRTTDGEFVIEITDYSGNGRSESLVGIKLTRVAPDPTPSDVFDPYRHVANSVELRFETDVTRFETSTVMPLLRTALTSFVDATMLNRLIAGEK